MKIMTLYSYTNFVILYHNMISISNLEHRGSPVNLQFPNIPSKPIPKSIKIASSSVVRYHESLSKSGSGLSNSYCFFWLFEIGLQFVGQHVTRNLVLAHLFENGKQFAIYTIDKNEAEGRKLAAMDFLIYPHKKSVTFIVINSYTI